MNLFVEALAWLVDPANWGSGDGLNVRLVEHLGFTALALLLAAIIAVPLGYLIGHTGKGREIAVGLSGAARALPSFGLILLLVLVLGVTQRGSAALIAFVLLGIPSILAGAYAGVEAADRRAVDAARAMGMTEWQILTKVEIPLGLPLLIGGLRSSTLQIVATVTLAAYVNLGGLGYGIIQGIELRRYEQMLASALLVVVVALLLDALFAVLERYAVPRGVRSGGGDASKRSSRSTTKNSPQASPAT